MLSQIESIIAVVVLIVLLALSHRGIGVPRFQFQLRARGGVEVEVAPLPDHPAPSERHDIVGKVLLCLERIEAKVERLVDRVS